MPRIGLIIGISAAVVVTTLAITLAFGGPATSRVAPVHALASQASSTAGPTETDFVDASVKGYPVAGAMFGNGQTIVFKYDGSKSESNSSAVLGYNLYYIRDDGTLKMMGGGLLDGRGTGDFHTSSILFNRNAMGRGGILELSVTYNAAHDAGKTDAYGLPVMRQTILGRFAVTYDIVDIRY